MSLATANKTENKTQNSIMIETGKQEKTYTGTTGYKTLQHKIGIGADLQ